MKEERVSSSVTLDSYLKNIRTWVVINYFMAAMVPLEVASRYFQVQYQSKYLGHVNPVRLAVYFRLALGILSLFAALNYQWKKRNAGIAFGALLCMGGLYYWGTIAYHAIFHPVSISVSIGVAFPAATAVLLYALQLHFVSSYFREMPEDA
jgi:hypothetical protein